jgi:hypothetical protein
MRVFPVVPVLVFAVACGNSPPPVSFVSNEQPTSQGAPETSLDKGAAHIENPNGQHAELGEDELVEPEHPLAETKQERALVHIHAPDGHVCSGVVIGTRQIATSQRCLKGAQPGVNAVTGEYRVEVASSALTWTNRKGKYTVVPGCDEHAIDIGILVLDDAVPAMAEPLKIASAPDTGGQLQALGFGRCKGSSKIAKERTGPVRSRDQQTVTIDVALCKGDRGGPVVDGRESQIVGLISHRDDPEGSPLRTATIARLDTVWARDLLAQAKTMAEGGDMTRLQAVSCK